MSLHRISAIALAVVVAGVTAFSAASASAQAPFPTRDRVQTHNNAAGVIFHPHGDYFEIWDNVKDDRPVRVSYNYVGVDDKIKRVTSRVHHGRYKVKLKEFPHQIYFRITGHLKDGKQVKSEIVKYRTYGT